MGMFYQAESDRFRTLSNIDDFDEEIDVFVSHKSEDKAIAKRVARCICAQGLTPWLDVIDLATDRDDETIVDRIEVAISKSLSLLAVVTDVTNESWWVPFEIGIAYDRKKQLASYCEDYDSVERPSFLWRWPLVKDRYDLRKWCGRILSLKREILPHVLAEAGTESDFHTRGSYQKELASIRNMLNPD